MKVATVSMGDRMFIFEHIRFFRNLMIKRYNRKETRITEKDIQKIKSTHKIKELFYEKFKDNPEYSKQNGKNINCHELRLSNLRITKIASKVFFENITFSHVVFPSVILNKVCFHNCRFYGCKFENITTCTDNAFISSPVPQQGFSCCDFMCCTFENCRLHSMMFSIGIFKWVKFINTEFDNVIFQMNAFDYVRFEKSCNLQDFYIFSPSGMFNVDFGSNKDHIGIDNHSVITPFIYKDKFNICDLNTYKIFKKDHYQKVADSYYSFECLIKDNKLRDHKTNCFYQRKKAETRSKRFIQSLPGYLWEYCFGYGEKPGRSIIALIATIFIYAPLYMLSGFHNGTKIINYTINGDFSLSYGKIKDFLESVYFSFFTLVTVGQGTPSPSFLLTKILSASELLIGAIIMTTFTATLFKKITD